MLFTVSTGTRSVQASCLLLVYIFVQDVFFYMQITNITVCSFNGSCDVLGYVPAIGKLHFQRWCSCTVFSSIQVDVVYNVNIHALSLSYQILLHGILGSPIYMKFLVLQSCLGLWLNCFFLL